MISPTADALMLGRMGLQRLRGKGVLEEVSHLSCPHAHRNNLTHVSEKIDYVPPP